ncbi:MAG: dicarboxylate/amino acid:cation symporter [Alphaproteobacteria bacterium]|nr:dicarboxylate/amino acid:cation symporter [Alphaproteobacteria bacterium]
MRRTFAIALVLGMLLGIASGLLIRELLDTEAAKNVTGALDLATLVFLRLVRMIIAPLVLSTLIVGIAHMGDAATIGRIGARTLVWFLVASLVSMSLGLLFVHAFQPGVGLALSHGGAVAANAPALTLKDFIGHLVPRSIVEAMANNEILQIVVFAAFVGAAMIAMQDRAPAVLALAEQVAGIMLKVTGTVMLLAPLVVFAALASSVAGQGAGILFTYAKFIGGFYVAVAALWALLFAVAVFFLGSRATGLFQAVRDPVLLAFATASSEAAYPRLLQNLQAFGQPKQVVNFVLPLGYSFNLDGSMLYLTFAVVFVAQAYGISLPLGQQFALLGLMMVMSKGMAGVPRASIVVLAAALPYSNLPEAGIALVLAVDQVLDMGRSATNIVGNSVACVVVSAWNGKTHDKATAYADQPVSPGTKRASSVCCPRKFSAPGTIRY